MADIFISYARPNRGKIEQLATALETQGFNLWWEREYARLEELWAAAEG